MNKWRKLESEKKVAVAVLVMVIVVFVVIMVLGLVWYEPIIDSIESNKGV